MLDKLEAVELGLDHNEVPTGTNNKQGKEENVPDWFGRYREVRGGKIVPEKEELSEEAKKELEILQKKLGIKEVAATTH